MGVAVSETTMEMAMATERTTANSRNRRPTMPGIIRIGMKTAMSEMLIDSTVKPISCGAAQGGLHRLDAVLDMARDVFDDHDGVVHHEAGRDGQRHQREVVEGVAEQVHGAEGG